MDRRLALLAALVVAISCKGDGKKAEPGPSTAPEKGAKEDAQPTATGGDGDVAPGADLARQCADSCLLLSTHKLSELDGDGYCKVCGAHDKTACSAPNPFARDNCDQFDYQRNCIYAANGYNFKKKRWRDTFGKKPWYVVNADFAEKDLTLLETANIRALRNRVSVCSGKALGPVSAKDVERVVAFFKMKEAKKLKLPKRLYVDGAKASEEEFKSFLNTEGLFRLKKHTPMTYTEWGPDDQEELDREKFRSISVATGVPGPDCVGEDEECEGFEWLDMVLDADGNIVVLSLGAAACPFLYVAADDSQLTAVGEILRNLSYRHREASQKFALPREVSCGEILRVEVREEKDERTFLDEIFLEVGGVVIAPRDCGGDGSLCDNDGVYRELGRGERASLTFAIPAEVRCQPAALVANGYYRPE